MERGLHKMEATRRGDYIERREMSVWRGDYIERGDNKEHCLGF